MSPSRHAPRWLRSVGAVVVAACSLAVAGCGTDDASPRSTEAPRPSVVATTSGATTPETPVAIVGIHDDVAFYPACGNETLLHRGITWFPFARAGLVATDPSFERIAAEVASVEREQPPDEARHGMVRVAPPGPGDDTGTLAVWADGVANWTSENGALEVWMVDDELTYDWVC